MSRVPPESPSPEALPPLTLASASPRRATLLAQLGRSFQVRPVDLDEIAHDGETPHDFVLRMAREKEQAGAHLVKSGFTLGGDTVIAHRGEILGKPSSPSAAEETLGRLSGEAHQVLSGWAIADQSAQIIASGVSEAQVRFHPLSPTQIQAYVESGEPLDKAGSYAIQGGGGRFVASLEGDFDGVVGMPTRAVAEALIQHALLRPRDPALLRRLLQIRARLQRATIAGGRSVDQVKLIGVSKRQPVEALAAACDHKLTRFGENYIQELLEKGPTLEARLNQEARAALEWHFIGQLQKRKTQRLATSVDRVHSLWREKEARWLQEGAERAERTQPIPTLIQVNLSGEESKQGVTREALPALLDTLRAFPAVQVCGLMTFPPYGEPESSRPWFKALRALRDELKATHPQLTELSMGVSHDFHVAAEEGATFVRVGSALFGPRG